MFGKLKFWKQEETLPPTSLEEFLPKTQQFPELNQEALDKAHLDQESATVPVLEQNEDLESPVLQPSVPSFIQQTQSSFQQVQQPPQFVQPSQIQQQPVIPPAVEKELQLISAKLDTLKALLEGISDKLDYGKKELRWR